jgi:hypothetical protein
VAGVAGVIDVAARGEVGNDLGGDVGRGAPTPEPRGELRAAPGTTGEQVARREAGGLDVENLAGRYDFSGAGALSPSVSRILFSSSNSAV